MSMRYRTDIYRAATPFGIIEIDFPEDGPCILEGNEDAIAHFLYVLDKCVTNLGISITRDNLEPAWLEDFCQPPGSLVSIIAPLQ